MNATGRGSDLGSGPGNRVEAEWRRRASIEVGESVKLWAQSETVRRRPPGVEDVAAKTEQELSSWLRAFSSNLIRSGHDALSDAEESDLRGFVAASFGSLPATVQQLVDSGRYSDIHVMGTRVMCAERLDGTREEFPSPFASNEELVSTVRRWASTGMNREFSDAAPILDMMLGDRIRVAASYVVSDEPEFSLRLASDEFRTLGQLQAAAMFSRPVMELLEAAVAAGVSMMICGTTGSGKTTLETALLDAAARDRRIVIIEDEREIRLDRTVHPNVVNQSTRPANMAGEGRITLADLVRQSLRKRPDWVVCGEVRGPEAFELCLLAIQGNSIMSTIHGHSTDDMVDRLSLFIAQASMQFSPEFIASLMGKGIGMIIHVAQIDGRRRITNIVEVTGSVDRRLSTVPLFSADERGDACLDIPTRSVLMDRLFAAGLDPTVVSPEPYARAFR